MDTTILVDELYSKGKTLLQGLDASGYNIPVALLIDLENEGGWSIMFGLDDLDSKGPRSYYAEIFSIIKERGLGISLNEIKLVDLKSPLILSLKQMIKTAPGISKITFTNNYSNGVKIPDCIIYRIN
jgi:hypothetical protein